MTLKISSISVRVGIAGPAPTFVIVINADCVAKSKQFSTDYYSKRPMANAEMKASPAPVVSTNSNPNC